VKRRDFITLLGGVAAGGARAAAGIAGGRISLLRLTRDERILAGRIPQRPE